MIQYWFKIKFQFHYFFFNLDNWLYLILTTIESKTPTAVTIAANKRVYSVPIVWVTNPAIAVTLNVAILDAIITILVIFPLDTGNKSDIVDTASWSTPPAAENPIINPTIIQIVYVLNINIAIKVTNDISGYINKNLAGFINFLTSTAVKSTAHIDPNA